MTVEDRFKKYAEKSLKKYKEKYPNVPYEIEKTEHVTVAIVSRKDKKIHSYGDAPAYVNFFNNSKQWFKDGKLNRENDKPAIIYFKSGMTGWRIKEWYYEGKRHREYGKPARMTKSGDVKEYWYEGKQYNFGPKDQINKITTKKSSKQKEREDLLKEFVCEVLST